MLHSAMERNREHRAECRVYRCDVCRSYHLTSMTIEEYEAKKAEKVSQTHMHEN